MTTSDKAIWTEDDMIDAAVEWWADEDLDGHDCAVRRGTDAAGDPCLVVLHKPTGRTSAEMGDGGRWHLDGTAYGD